MCVCMRHHHANVVPPPPSPHAHHLRIYTLESHRASRFRPSPVGADFGEPLCLHPSSTASEARPSTTPPHTPSQEGTLADMSSRRVGYQSLGDAGDSLLGSAAVGDVEAPLPPPPGESEIWGRGRGTCMIQQRRDAPHAQLGGHAGGGTDCARPSDPCPPNRLAHHPPLTHINHSHTGPC